MRIRFLSAVVSVSVLTCILATSPLSSAAAPPVTETILLRYVKPSDALTVVAPPKAGDKTNKPQLPVGIESAMPDDNKLTLTVKGDEAEIARLRALVQLVDVAPRVVQLKMRIVKVRVDANGKTTQQTLQKPIIATNNNEACRFEIKGGAQITVDVTPYLNDNGVVLLRHVMLRLTHVDPVEFGLQAMSNKRTLEVEGSRRFPAGKETRVIGVSDSHDERIAQAVQNGEIVTNGEIGYTAYYLMMTATEVKMGNTP